MSTSQASSNTPNSTWSEPPWSGWIETTGDALLILEAARRGLIPRVTRRLVDSERKMITSGSVFVFDEDESGIKRWTDGFFWSPSRILGNFLLYRETDKRGAGHRGGRSDPQSPDGGDPAHHGADDTKADILALSRPKGESNQPGVDKQRERTLVGSLTNSYKFKPDGLMKKTFSLTIAGVAQHLISYYKIEDVKQGRLRSPSSLPELACLVISPEYLDKTHFRNPPKVEIGLDGIPRYRGEAEVDGGDPLLPIPLSPSDHPNSPDSGSGRRTKRYDPYSNGTSKRSRKSKPGSLSRCSPPSEAQTSPTAANSIPSPTAPQSDTSALTSMPAYPQYPPYPVPSYYPYSLGPHHPHVVPGNPYSGNSSSPAAASQVPATPGQGQQLIAYPGYPASPPNGDPAPVPPSGPQSYYYYSSPHAHYPGYTSWSHYGVYAQPPTPSQAPVESDSKPNAPEVEGVNEIG